MGAVKKILERLFQAGNSVDGREGLVCLRGFGKLPNYLEYQHLEDSSGVARAFQEWVAAGHQHWVQMVPVQERGELTTTDVAGILEDNPEEVVVARLWQSRDSANPPRRFPFTFFVTIPADQWTEEPLDALIRSSRLWASLQIAFDRQHLIYERGGTFQRFYREQKVGVEFEDAADEVERVRTSAKAIPLKGWLDTVVPVCQANDPKTFLYALRSLVRGWDSSNNSCPVSVIRLPLSPLFRIEVQAAVWIRWLEVNLNRPLSVCGTMVGHSTNGKPACLTILTRPLDAEHFLLATPSANHCQSAEDVCRLAVPADELPREGQPEEHPIDIMLGNEYSVWDWASISLIAAPLAQGDTP